MISYPVLYGPTGLWHCEQEDDTYFMIEAPLDGPKIAKGPLSIDFKEGKPRHDQIVEHIEMLYRLRRRMGYKDSLAEIKTREFTPMLPSECVKRKLQFPVHIQPFISGQRRLVKDGKFHDEYLNPLPVQTENYGLFLDGVIDSKGNYQIFDCISGENYENRIEKIQAAGFEVIPTYKVDSEGMINYYHQKFIEQGYKTSMIRLIKGGYEQGISKKLLKI